MYPKQTMFLGYSVAAVMYLQFVLHVMLFYMLIRMYFTLALLKYVCNASLLGYCLRNFEMVPLAPFISGTIFIFTFHMRCDSVVSSLYLGIFWASFLATFLSSLNCHIINTHVPLLLSRIMMSGFWLWTVLPACSNSFHSMIYFTVMTFMTNCHMHTSVHCLLLPLSLHSSARTLSCLFSYCSCANTEHADTVCSTVLSKC